MAVGSGKAHLQWKRTFRDMEISLAVHVLLGDGLIQDVTPGGARGSVSVSGVKTAQSFKPGW